MIFSNALYCLPAIFTHIQVLLYQRHQLGNILSLRRKFRKLIQQGKDLIAGQLDGWTLTFEFADDRITDGQTNSDWNIFGRAISGELAGRQLPPGFHQPLLVLVGGVQARDESLSAVICRAEQDTPVRRVLFRHSIAVAQLYP